MFTARVWASCLRMRIAHYPCLVVVITGSGHAECGQNTRQRGECIRIFTWVVWTSPKQFVKFDCLTFRLPLKTTSTEGACVSSVVATTSDLVRLVLKSSRPTTGDANTSSTVLRGHLADMPSRRHDQSTTRQLVKSLNELDRPSWLRIRRLYFAVGDLTLLSAAWPVSRLTRRRVDFWYRRVDLSANWPPKQLTAETSTNLQEWESLALAIASRSS